MSHRNTSRTWKNTKTQTQRKIGFFYKQKEMIPLTNEDTKFYEEQKVCHICKEEYCNNENDKNKNKFKL